MTRPLRVVAPEDAYPALREALAGGPAVFVGSAADLPERVEQRIALVVETSGSAGAPKRVALSADALLASAAASESALGGPGQWVLALPTHYIAGINVLTRSLAAGLDPVPVAGSGFTATGFAEAARRLEVPERYTALVPAQLATLLDDPDATAELRRFRAVLVGGQATPVPLRERASASGVRIVRTYGSSETSGGCVYDGAPIGQTAVRVEDGEVWLGGPTLAEGYLGDPALTAERFVVADGLHWFRTSDAGEWDGERLQITGRRDDVLISGGVKVAPGAVERVLHGVPGFADAVVVGIPDARWGEVPVAITAGTGDDRTAVDAVGAALGNPARPARIIHLDALPLLPSGKPDRVALASLAARGSDDTAR
jgi:O-succinylbenzoic acid--CoA ligase